MVHLKKILFLTHVGDPGGAEYAMIDLCCQINNPLEVIYMQDGKLKKILADFNIKNSLIQMPTALNGFKKNSGILSVIKLIPSSVKVIFQIIKKCKQADIIVCISQKSFIIASLGKIFFKKPIIWFMNDILSDTYFSAFTIKLIKFFSYYFANSIILNSEASYLEWKNQNAVNRTEIIYPGINHIKLQKYIIDNQEKKLELRKKFLEKNKPIVAIIGRISSWKGQHILLEAAKINSNFNIIIVGDSFFDEKAYEKSLHQFIKDNQLEERVFFVGHVDDPIIYMAASDIIAHCSTNPEPFGRVIIEGIIAKKPVIATNAGGAVEIIKHEKTGLLTEMSDPYALSDAINYFINNPQHVENLVQSAQTHVVNNFTLDISVKKFEAVLVQMSRCI